MEPGEGFWEDTINTDESSERRDSDSDSIKEAAISEFEFISRSSGISVRRRTHPTGRGYRKKVSLCRRVGKCSSPHCRQPGCLRVYSVVIFSSGAELLNYRTAESVFGTKGTVSVCHFSD